MQVSVILNCFNGERFLKRSIESILNQTFDIYEIVFIDNNSSDSSSEIAKGYGSIISYYRNDETFTLGKARDQGIMLAKGDLIAFIDADDEWKEDKIEKQALLFNENVSFVFSNTEMAEVKGNGFKLFDYAEPHIDNLFNSLLEKDFISTSSVIFKKNLYLNSNEKYNKDLTMECDRDLFLRLIGASKSNFTNECLVTRYLHDSSTSTMRNAASIKEFLILEASINNFNMSKKEDSVHSLKIFNSRLNMLKGRHYWQLGDLKNSRKNFLKSFSGKSYLLFLLSFIYPFKSKLKPIIYIFRFQKFLANRYREIIKSNIKKL
jgi:glycosyltransferase involved in cell wall biosynthesis